MYVRTCLLEFCNFLLNVFLVRVYYAYLGDKADFVFLQHLFGIGRVAEVVEARCCVTACVFGYKLRTAWMLKFSKF